MRSQSSSRLTEVTRLSLKLGATAFGGPAAHIAMLRNEVVDRQRWVTDQHFLDLIGVTNLIPGPNSTEMVMHIGQLRAGRRGLITAGTAFILPAAAITLTLAWFYVKYGSTPEGEWLFYGVKPVVIAVVLQALFRLAQSAAKDSTSIVVGMSVLVLYLLGGNEILLMIGGGFVLLLVRRALAALRDRRSLGIAVAPWLLARVNLAAASDTVTYSHLRLFLTFLKIGSLLYGSGYVLIAFVRNDFVVRLGWLTEQQLLDAVAVGQLTPGPVFTTATFIGYVVGGFPGAVLATVGIFLPAFVFVGLTGNVAGWMRRHATLGLLLDGVNVAAVGLMAGVAITLARNALVDVTTLIVAAVSGALLIRYRISTTWLIAFGVCVGLARWLLA